MPLITPVAIFKLNPPGSEGVTEKAVAPPDGVIAGLRLVIAVSLVSVRVEGEYDTEICDTVKVKLTVILPPLFVALICTTAEEYRVVGVPDNAPVPEIKDIPAGSVPEISW